MRSSSRGAVKRPTRARRNTSQNNRRNSPTQIHAIGMQAYHGQYSGQTISANPREIHAQLLAKLTASLTYTLLHTIRPKSRPVTSTVQIRISKGLSGVCFSTQRMTLKKVAEPPVYGRCTIPSKLCRPAQRGAYD